jgi:hypothetical protein
MTNVLIYQYSHFYHPTTDTEFTPVCDCKSGAWLGIAEVDETTDAGKLKLDAFAKNPCFKILSADEYAALTSLPAAPDAAILTGDPLSDAALVTDTTATDAATDSTKSAAKASVKAIHADD